jgi:hypothetical protein
MRSDERVGVTSLERVALPTALQVVERRSIYKPEVAVETVEPNKRDSVTTFHFADKKNYTTGPKICSKAIPKGQTQKQETKWQNSRAPEVEWELERIKTLTTFFILAIYVRVRHRHLDFMYFGYPL